MADDEANWDSQIKIGDVQMWSEATLEAIDRLVAREAASERVMFADITEAVIVVRHLAQADQITVVWAANHIVTSYDRLRKPARERLGAPPGGLHATVRHLRNVLEHWDEHRSAPKPVKAHQRLLSANPEAAPWTTSWTPSGGIVLANCLRIDDLRVWVASVRDNSMSMLLEGLRALHDGSPGQPST